MKHHWHRLTTKQAWLPIVGSLVGLILTHGIALACIVYCAVIQSDTALIAHHGHHHHQQPIQLIIDDFQHLQPAPFTSGVLEQGHEVPLALATMLLVLVSMRIARWVYHALGMLGRSWIERPLAPPPRYLGCNA